MYSNQTNLNIKDNVVYIKPKNKEECFIIQSLKPLYKLDSFESLKNYEVCFKNDPHIFKEVSLLFKRNKFF
jgi:hypothetical protein